AVEHMLVLNLHHIAADGRSCDILMQELTFLYSAAASGTTAILPPLPIQYADYAIWQRRWLTSELLAGKLGYWRNQLAGVGPLELPVDHPRPAVQSSRGASLYLPIDDALQKAMQDLSRCSGATLFMTLLAAFKVLLFRYGGQEDICVGTPVTGRTQQETEGLIGFFINTLPLRSNLGGNPSFSELLAAVKNTALAAYDHQEVPFEKMVEEALTERDLARSPLFQVMFMLQHTLQAPSLRLGDTVLTYEPAGSGQVKFDLTVTITEEEQGLGFHIAYCRDLYEEDTIRRMAVHYVELLRSIAEAPDRRIGELGLLTAAEKQQLTEKYTSAGAGYPDDKTIVDLFASQAARTPEAVALVFEQETVTYRQLDERSNRLAHYLRRLGVKEETPVAICLEKAPEMIVGILGILKAAGFYVPIDPQYPVHRIGYILGDTAAPVVLTSRGSHAVLPLNYTGQIVRLDEDGPQITAGEDTPPPTLLRPGHLAYVIYTSGSTGQPKGVMIEHRNVIRLFITETPLYDFNERDVWTLFHSFAFDFSVWEIFGALLFGGRLVIVPKAVARDVPAFARLLTTQGVTVLNQTPSAFYVLQDYLPLMENTLSIRLVIFGGEALDPQKVAPWKRRYPASRLVNMYGITETTVHVTSLPIGDRHLERSSSVIGTAIPTTTVYILDSRQQLSPMGIAGEIYVGGAGLARGYLNQPALTAEKFIADPFSGKPGARLYKSGDLGRWLPDGTIEYLGRI
ncbi:MAG TPA: amino acid adenylation domain-containing protein, partial [Puia sp.]|nr:amino acid adenylation domain-containing protein [Puia sp.]